MNISGQYDGAGHTLFCRPVRKVQSEACGLISQARYTANVRYSRSNGMPCYEILPTAC